MRQLVIGGVRFHPSNAHQVKHAKHFKQTHGSDKPGSLIWMRYQHTGCFLRGRLLLLPIFGDVSLPHPEMFAILEQRRLRGGQMSWSVQLNTGNE